MPKKSPIKSARPSTVLVSPERRRFALERLEPRWLLSATPLAAALSSTWMQFDSAEATSLAASVVNAEAATPPGVQAQGDHVAWDVGASLPAAVVSEGSVEGVATLASGLGSEASAVSWVDRLDHLVLDARQRVQDHLADLTAADVWELFPGQSDASSPESLAQAQAVLERWQAGGPELYWVLVSGASMPAAKAAFTANGPNGEATIFVNADWAARSRPMPMCWRC